MDETIELDDGTGVDKTSGVEEALGLKVGVVDGIEVEATDELDEASDRATELDDELELASGELVKLEDTTDDVEEITELEMMAVGEDESDVVAVNDPGDKIETVCVEELDKLEELEEGCVADDDEITDDVPVIELEEAREDVDDETSREDDEETSELHFPKPFWQSSPQ
jgi:hypothetical protein